MAPKPYFRAIFPIFRLFFPIFWGRPETYSVAGQRDGVSTLEPLDVRFSWVVPTAGTEKLVTVWEREWVTTCKGVVASVPLSPWCCEGFIRHRPRGPHPRIRLALPSSGVDLASIQHRFDIEIGSNQEIDVESMSNRC